MRSVVLESLEELKDYRESWDAFRLECGAPVFSCYDLVHLWLDNFKEVVSPYIILIEDGGELVGAAPMCTNHARAMGLPINSISMVGNLSPLFGYTLHSVLVKRDDPEVVKELLRCVEAAKWNKLIMSEMETNISTLRFLDGVNQMGNSRPASLNVSIDRSYVFPPEGNIMAEFGKSTRRNLQKVWNRLEKEGNADLRKVKGVGDAERAMDLHLSQHGERWENKNSSFRNNNNRRLMMELGKLAVRTGKGEISELLIDGEVAGQVLSLFDGDVSRGIRVGMMERFQDYSPGKMALTMTMESHRDMGLKAMDFGHGNDDYKLGMTNSHRPLGSAMIYKGTMLALSRVRSFPPVKVLESRFHFSNGVVGRMYDS
jgi:hypothetical protein